MSAKPYFDEEVEAARAHLATVSQLDAKSGDTIAVCRDIERRWLATVDALKARLAAAEAEAESARGLLARCRPYVCTIPAGRVDPESGHEGDKIASAIDAHLASRPEGEVRHG